jgi:hypothetical protein
MSDNLDEFARVTSPVPAVTHPKDWHPYVEMDSRGGHGVIVRQEAVPPDELELTLLGDSGADPDVWAIRNVSHRKWMNYAGEWLLYWKYDLIKRVDLPEEDRTADVEEIKKLFDVVRGPPATRGRVTTTDALVVVASDWQIGKGEGGGTEGTVTRWMDAVESIKRYAEELRSAGYGVPQLALLGTGDLHEQVCGFYPGQLFQIDLNKRDQMKVVRRMVAYAVRELAPLFDDVLLTAVGGNHGQASRPMGKQLTDPGDNDDVAVFEVVQEVIEGRDDFDHVRFQLPNDATDICVDIAGVPVALAHGHQFTSGGKLVQAKALEWWKNQTFGLQNTADARILVSSHFHHYSCIVHGARTHFQTPALDGGSRWFRDMFGSDAPAGVLAFRVDAGSALGWDHARVLTG